MWTKHTKEDIILLLSRINLMRLFSSSLIVSVATSLLLSSCSSIKDASKENFGKVISQYITNRPGCNNLVTELPYRDKFNTEADMKIMKRSEPAPPIISMLNFFTSLGYLNITEKQGTQQYGFSTIPAFYREYNLTDTGKKNYALDGHNSFCAVKRHELTKVVQFDEPVEKDGMKVVNVAYNYKNNGVAEWTKKTEFSKLFPNENTILSAKELRGRATLKLTSEGWEIISIVYPTL